MENSLEAYINMDLFHAHKLALIQHLRIIEYDSADDFSQPEGCQCPRQVLMSRKHLIDSSTPLWSRVSPL